MAGWIAFYTVTAAASATLFGLLFVAVSIGASGALNDPRSMIRILAEQSFQNYLLVLVLSCVALFPQTSTQAIGVTILLVTMSRALWAGVRLGSIIVHSHGHHMTLSVLRRQAAALIGIACLLVASARLAWTPAQDLHLLATGVLILLTSSAVASWELLLQLVQSRSSAADRP